MLKQPPYFLTTPARLQVRAGERSTAVVHSGTILPIKELSMLLIFGIPCTVCNLCGLCVQLHRDETTGNILNLVMVQADEGTMLKMNLPVEFNGVDACPGLKKGGPSVLQNMKRKMCYA
ncbi:uncharacterized protein LOC133883748 isoform X1 [Phragmites australis]|uniref:uncharacterized protein LOC133883748 isoform X1 n=1 Tax=Phragmites australis TaxID=29695 RepID=UPI002D77EFFD|nr:uncharacterized protein LOC133883748 isoform X1 [Phragmites australis]